jgi:hypothetical protein
VPLLFIHGGTNCTEVSGIREASFSSPMPIGYAKRRNLTFPARIASRDDGIAFAHSRGEMRTNFMWS